MVLSSLVMLKDWVARDSRSDDDRVATELCDRAAVGCEGLMVDGLRRS